MRQKENPLTIRTGIQVVNGLANMTNNFRLAEQSSDKLSKFNKKTEKLYMELIQFPVKCPQADAQGGRSLFFPLKRMAVCL